MGLLASLDKPASRAHEHTPLPVSLGVPRWTDAHASRKAHLKDTAAALHTNEALGSLAALLVTPWVHVEPSAGCLSGVNHPFHHQACGLDVGPLSCTFHSWHSWWWAFVCALCFVLARLGSRSFVAC